MYHYGTWGIVASFSKVLMYFKPDVRTSTVSLKLGSGINITFSNLDSEVSTISLKSGSEKSTMFSKLANGVSRGASNCAISPC